MPLLRVSGTQMLILMGKMVFLALFIEFLLTLLWKRLKITDFSLHFSEKGWKRRQISYKRLLNLDNFGSILVPIHAAFLKSPSKRPWPKKRRMNRHSKKVGRFPGADFTVFSWKIDFFLRIPGLSFIKTWLTPSFPRFFQNSVRRNVFFRGQKVKNGSLGPWKPPKN